MSISEQKLKGIISNTKCCNCDQGKCVPGYTINKKGGEEVKVRDNGCVAVGLYLQGFMNYPGKHCRCYREHPELHPFDKFDNLSVKGAHFVTKEDTTSSVSINDKKITDEYEPSAESSTSN
jgi:hypothetical protein